MKSFNVEILVNENYFLLRIIIFTIIIVTVNYHFTTIFVLKILNNYNYLKINIIN